MELQLITQMTDSRALALAVGKRHRDLLRSIRSMESGWVEGGGRSFALSSYKTEQGKDAVSFVLQSEEILYIASKFDDKLRAQIILRLKFLEEQASRQKQMQLDHIWDKLDREDLY